MVAQILEKITSINGKLITNIHFPEVMWTDIVEIIIISVLIYRLLLWI